MNVGGIEVKQPGMVANPACGSEPRGLISPDSARVWRVTVDPNSREQALRREKSQGKLQCHPCSVDNEQYW